MTSVSKKQTYVKPPERRKNCGQWTAFLELEGGDLRFGPLYCESWNCPACRGVKIQKLLDRLDEVEIVQYIEIEFPHRLADVKPILGIWLKAVKRDFREFEYMLVTRSETERTRVGLFLSSGSLPTKWVEESFLFQGLEARADSETLYRREGRRDKLVGLLDAWSPEDQFIHRISHSRKFFDTPPVAAPKDPRRASFVSRTPVAYWLGLCDRLGLPVSEHRPNVFLISRSVIGDRGVTPLMILFPDRAPPGMSSTQAKQADCRT